MLAAYLHSQYIAKEKGILGTITDFEYIVKGTSSNLRHSTAEGLFQIFHNKKFTSRTTSLSLSLNEMIEQNVNFINIYIILYIYICSI